MDAHAALRRALDATGEVVGGIGPDALGRPTPCTEWTVREVLNHLLGQLWAFHGRLGATESRRGAAPGGLPDSDLVGDDPTRAYAEVREAVLAAADQPGALESAGVTAGAYTTDTLVHGWDLATATSQPAPSDEELSAYCLEFVRMGITDDNRAPAFGPEAPAPPDATRIEELVAFCGRAPR